MGCSGVVFSSVSASSTFHSWSPAVATVVSSASRLSA